MIVNIIITDDAKCFAVRYGSVITIGFCGIGCVPIHVPAGEFIEPEEPDLYEKLEIDGITIYYPRGSVIGESGLRIELFTSGSAARLEVNGLYRGGVGGYPTG